MDPLRTVCCVKGCHIAISTHRVAIRDEQKKDVRCDSPQERQMLCYSGVPGIKSMPCWVDIELEMMYYILQRLAGTSWMVSWEC